MSGKWHWERASAITPLEGSRVDVWLIDLAESKDDALPDIDLLSDEERERVDGFKHEPAKHDFLVTRSTLRRLLAAYTGMDARSLTFVYAVNGKPALGTADTCVEFNVSHASGIALAAFSRQPVGVDIEQVGRKADIAGISRRFFSDSECEAVMSVEGLERSDRFYRIWTCKEACMKWTGRGISGGLDAHEISLDREPVSTGNGDQPMLWQFRPREAYVGALAACPGSEVTCSVWSGS